MGKTADLHIHTFYSDSSDSPEEVVQQAIQKNIDCIAITDHDTLDGVEPAQIAAEGCSLEVIPGIELSTEIHGKDVHMLGYFKGIQNLPLLRQLQIIQKTRIERIQKMIDLLQKQGVHNISLEQVCQQTHSDAVGRPHLAKILMEKGYVRSIPEAFEKYIGEECPAYVGKFKMTPYEAIDLLHRSGAIAVLAHPMILNKDELIPSFAEAGMDGIEAHYANCSDNVIEYYEGIARKHNLIVTGGSDAHGRQKGHTFIGKRTIPYTIVEQIKEKLAVI